MRRALMLTFLASLFRQWSFVSFHPRGPPMATSIGRTRSMAVTAADIAELPAAFDKRSVTIPSITIGMESIGSITSRIVIAAKQKRRARAEIQERESVPASKPVGRPRHGDVVNADREETETVVGVEKSGAAPRREVQAAAPGKLAGGEDELPSAGPKARGEVIDLWGWVRERRHGRASGATSTPSAIARLSASTARVPAASNAVPFVGDLPSDPSGRRKRTLGRNRMPSA